ncbi:hypothetical protein AL478_028405 [Klebsiella pneumoniae]|nr:hypothetical protein AL478_028405 [Klebsiella pneumoniae]
MYTSLDTQGRLSARLLSAQARSACLFFLLLLLFYSQGAYAHGVAEGDKGYIQEITGVNIIPFIYLGAKHMVTGYDHRHCCKVSDEAAFCLIQRPYISKTLLTRRISPRGSP